MEDFSYSRYAEDMLGFKGIRVDKPEDLGKAWEDAFAADRPVLLEIMSDPDVPPLPPHITLAQAKAFTETLMKGDPNEVGIIRQSVRDLMAGLLPGEKD